MDSRSLHYIGNTSRPNQYQIALKAVGEICQHYNATQQYLAVGFGAKLPPHDQISHDFPLVRFLWLLPMVHFFRRWINRNNSVPAYKVCSMHISMRYVMCDCMDRRISRRLFNDLHKSLQQCISMARITIFYWSSPMVSLPIWNRRKLRLSRYTGIFPVYCSVNLGIASAAVDHHRRRWR